MTVAGSHSGSAGATVDLVEWLDALRDRGGASAEKSTCRFGSRSGSGDAVLDPHNARLKLYLETPADLHATLLARLDRLSDEGVSKITVYSRSADRDAWSDLGFRHEGVIRGFFEESADAHIVARYLDPARATSDRESVHSETVRIACAKPARPPVKVEGVTSLIATTEDAPRITQLLANIFEDYPDPLTPERIESCIRERSHHFRLVLDDAGTLIAAASAEIDHARRSVEMTDCATLPSHRGRGLMAFTLAALEQDMLEIYRMDDLYTLARADEVGMNCAFARLGYEFTGRLVNNCRMPNGWESMNIWCRKAGTE